MKRASSNFTKQKVISKFFLPKHAVQCKIRIARSPGPRASYEENNKNHRT